MAFLCPVRIRRNKKKKPLDDESLQGVVPSMGRITGSASIETLVRVGIEKENGLGPESKMVVLHDFTPCVDDELEVKRGQIVHVLYQENDWVYVISEDNNEGFIPHSYCAQYGSQLATLALNVKKKLPRGGAGGETTLPPAMSMSPSRVSPPTGSMSSTAFANIMQHHQQQQKPNFSNPPDVLVNASQNQLDGKTGGPNMTSEGHNLTMGTTATTNSGGRVNPGMDHSDTDSFHDVRVAGQRGANNEQSRSNSLMSETSSQPDIHPFYKDPSGRYVVLYSYAAQDENDLSVERGQCVTVLNTDDPDWFWVRRYDQQEGFVPSGFIYPLDAIQRQQGFSSGPMTAPSAPSSYNQVVGHNFPSPGNQFHPHLQQQQQQHGTMTSSTPQTRPIQGHNTTWNGGSAGSSGPPSFTNPQQHGFGGGAANMSTVTTNSFAGDLVQSSHKGLRPPSALGGATSHGGSVQQQQQQPGGCVPPGPPSQNGLPSADLCYNGTELVVLYDYKAQAPDDLTVRRGDWVYADLNNQTVDGWLWTYAPKTRKYGFIPKAYAKPPAMTSL